MEVNRYTEYVELFGDLKAIVQVPESQDLPVQIILNIGGKVLFFGKEDFVAIVKHVAQALAEAKIEVEI